MLWLMMGVIAGLLFWASRGTLPRNQFLAGECLAFPIQASSPTPGTTLRCMTYNIGFAGGADGLSAARLSGPQLQDNLEAIISTVREYNPDILAIQEIDIHSRRSGHIDQVRTLATTLGYPYVAVSYTWDIRWVPYPTTWKIWTQFGRTLAAQAVFSKYPIQKFRTLRFAKPSANSWIYNLFYLDRVAQFLEIFHPKMGPISVINVHLEAWNAAAKAAQMTELLHNIDPTHKVILMGDFNTVPSGATQKSGFSDDPKDTYIKDTLYARLQNAQFTDTLATNTPEEETLFWTFPNPHPSRRLDYIWLKGLTCIKRGKISETRGSDHSPIFSEVCF